MHKTVKYLLNFSVVHYLLVTSAYAGNPASKEYVDAQINRVNTQLELQSIPSGGTTGQVLAKASNSNYNTQWVNASGGGGLYKIGQHLGADVIFFVYEDGAGVEHALVAAPADEPGSWDWASAVTQCATKNTGGYTWILPDKAQLTALFNNRFAIAPNDPNNNGGFALDVYWSSTPVVASPGSVWFQGFADASQNMDVVGASLIVRCIRVLP